MSPGSPNPPLRIGLLLDSLEVPAWIVTMMQEVVASGAATLELVVLNGSVAGAPGERHLGRFVRWWRDRAYILYNAYMRYERWRFRAEPDAFRRSDLAPLVADVPTITVHPQQTRFSDRLSDPDVARVREHDLDVLVRLGFRILRGSILAASRYGVWSFHHGAHDTYRGGPPGFWEVFEADHVTGAMLQVLTEDLDNGKVLAATYAATHPISVRLNRNNYYWKSLALLPRILRRFRDAGPEAVEVGALAANHPPRFYSRRLYTRPTNRAFVAPLARHIARRTRRTLVDRLWWDQWILLFDMRDDLSTSPWRFTPIIPPRDRFWADPHIVYRDGTYYVFIEEYLYAQRKGRIAVLEMDESGRHGSPRVALETPFHLSYPHLFTWEDQLYMVPESGDHGRIDVYRCQDFPFGWMHDTTLLRDHLAVDATLFEGHDRWWLFTNIQERPGASPSEELFLFHAPSPLSQKWQPHPMNPVVSDARSSRPAGRLFVRDGVVYRPSQDCSRGYGYGLRLNRIVTLTPNEYREEEVTRIEPRWHRRITGVHSLAHEGRLTMIDAKRRRSRLSGQGR